MKSNVPVHKTNRGIVWVLISYVSRGCAEMTEVRSKLQVESRMHIWRSTDENTNKQVRRNALLSHSLRAGGTHTTCTSLASLSSEFMTGGWSSQAFRIYLRQNPILLQSSISGHSTSIAHMLRLRINHYHRPRTSHGLHPGASQAFLIPTFETEWRTHWSAYIWPISLWPVCRYIYLSWIWEHGRTVVTCCPMLPALSSCKS